MTFAAREESRTLGEPVELFLFRFGEEAEAYHAYTDHEDAITYNDIVYQPAPISRGDIGSAGTGERTDLEITMSRDSALADRFVIFPPSGVVNLTIFAGHVGESQFIRIWGGRLLGVSRKGSSEVALVCESRSRSLKRGGLRRKYGTGCPHLLFGADCKANKPAATVTKTVVSVAGSEITLASDWADSGNRPKFVGGVAEWVSDEGFTERRTIVSVGDGDGKVLLNGYATGLVAEASISLIWGCNHLESGCNIHGNIQNYGGQLWIPLENPIGFRNLFS